MTKCNASKFVFLTLNILLSYLYNKVTVHVFVADNFPYILPYFVTDIPSVCEKQKKHNVTDIPSVCE